MTEITAERIAGAISFGSLMGARGNSGVITSQIFRGMAEGIAGKSRFNGLDLAHALTQGAKNAYGAVARPVEGTILTVIREAADAAVATAEGDERHRGRARGDRRRRREVRRPDPVASCRSCARPASSTPAARACSACSRARSCHLTGRAPVGVAPSRPSARTAEPRHARRPHRRGFRLRALPCSVPAAANRSTSTRSTTARGDRRSVLVAGDEPGAQGPRPQRAAGRGHRLWAGLGSCHGSPSRTSTARPRRPRGERGRVHRCGARRRRPCTAPRRCAVARRRLDEVEGARPARRLPLGVIAVAPAMAWPLSSRLRRRQYGRPRRPVLKPVDRGTAQRHRGDPGRRGALLPNNPNVVLAARRWRR